MFKTKAADFIFQFFYGHVSFWVSLEKASIAFDPRPIREKMHDHIRVHISHAHFEMLHTFSQIVTLNYFFFDILRISRRQEEVD